MPGDRNQGFLLTLQPSYIFHYLKQFDIGHCILSSAEDGLICLKTSQYKFGFWMTQNKANIPVWNVDLPWPVSCDNLEPSLHLHAGTIKCVLSWGHVSSPVLLGIGVTIVCECTSTLSWWSSVTVISHYSSVSVACKVELGYLSRLTPMAEIETLVLGGGFLHSVWSSNALLESLSILKEF